MSIPSGMAINPIKKTNEEDIGVIPEEKATPEETFDTAYARAMTAAVATSQR